MRNNRCSHSLCKSSIFFFSFSTSFRYLRKEEEGIWKKAFRTKLQTHWPAQLPHVSGIECQSDHFACFAAYFHLFRKKMHFKITKSAWVPRSAVFGMRMPGGWLHRSCDSLARSVFPSCWVLSAIFFPSRPPPRLVGFFSTDVFSVWRVPVPFLWCGGSWLGCAVVPVMGALFQSRGWLPIVEALGYFRHPTSILVVRE